MALISCVNRPSIQLCSSGAIVTVYPVGYIFTGEFLPGDSFTYEIYPHGYIILVRFVRPDRSGGLFYYSTPARWRGTVVERRSLAGDLSLSCARPAADG